MHAGIQSLGTPHPPDRGDGQGHQTITRQGDPMTVGLTRLGQTRVLEERPTRPSDRMSNEIKTSLEVSSCTVGSRHSCLPHRLWRAFMGSRSAAVRIPALCGRQLVACASYVRATLLLRPVLDWRSWPCLDAHVATRDSPVLSGDIL